MCRNGAEGRGERGTSRRERNDESIRWGIKRACIGTDLAEEECPSYVDNAAAERHEQPERRKVSKFLDKHIRWRERDFRDRLQE